MRVWLWRSGRWGAGCQVLCPGRGFLPVSETLSGLPIGLTMVSERRQPAPALVPPRVPRWSDGALVSPRVAVASQGHAGCLGPGRAAGHGSCGVEQCWAAEQDAAVRGGPQQCPQMPDLLRVNHSLPYEWRPLRPSIREFTTSRVCACGRPQRSTEVAGGQSESPFPPVSARVGTYATHHRVEQRRRRAHAVWLL